MVKEMMIASMPARSRRTIALASLTAILASCAARQDAQPPDITVVLPQEIADQLQGPAFYVDFVQDVKPILESNCLACHHSGSGVTSLSFETFADVRAANRKHQLVIPGEPERSSLFLVTVIPDHFTQAMPRGAGGDHRLSKGDYMILHHWIAQGAEWPDGKEGTLRSPSTPLRPPREKRQAPYPPDII